MDHLIWASGDDTNAQGQRIAANEVPEHRWSGNPGWSGMSGHSDGSETLHTLELLGPSIFSGHSCCMNHPRFRVDPQSIQY